MRPVVIYSLSCPKSGQIRYVGKTINIAKRIDSHLNVPKKLPSSMWIQSLKKEGHKPIFEILAENVEDWQAEETYWICQLRAWGFKLLNLTQGGEGCHGIKQTEAHKKRRSTSMLGKNKGKTMSEGAKAKISSYQIATGSTKGFKNGRSKYSITQIKKVKDLLSSGTYSKIAIARLVGVNHNLVYEISYGKKWKDV